MNSKIIKFAIQTHDKVNHLYDGAPYSVHLSMVAMYAERHINTILTVDNEWYEKIISACWLHDTIEDCRLTYNDVKEVAGEDVAEIVYALTNEKGKTRKDRANEAYYAGIRGVAYASFVKLCDRLANAKYSKDSNSKMLEVYKKENEDFIDHLLPRGGDKNIYKDMIKELRFILS